MSKTKGYNPNDTMERRIMKASFFVKNMVKNGQATDSAYLIASRYYRVTNCKQNFSQNPPKFN